MKECPNCRKVYADDLFFCLEDGSSLAPLQAGVDHAAATEAAIDSHSLARTEVLPAPVSVKTEVLPPRQPVPPTQVIAPQEQYVPRPRRSKLPYIIIVLLVGACLGLAGLLIALNLDRILPAANVAVVNSNKVNSPTQSPAPSPAPVNTRTTNTTSPANKPVANADPERAYNATGLWKGSWSTDSGSLFDFELDLTSAGGDDLNGQIRWTMRRTARPDKAEMVGLSATEYVRGSYSPATGVINLTGYKKDDPNGMLVMLDTYKLNIAGNNRAITGNARNGGKWNGHIRLTK